MIISFKTTEKSAKIIEANNVLVLEVNRKARKADIKKEAEEKLGAKVDKVNTLIKDNKKYAYIKLNKKTPAIDIATKFGII